MDAEDLLYILYTSGTTGKPKGIVHTTGGYLVGTYATTKWIFDLKDDDVFWCTADIGWVTGHSYVVYGPLSNGATVVMYEGSPDWPDKDRFWDLIERHGVSVFYTAPTAIRSFMRWGTEWPARHDMKTLRLLGSVGEPINPEAWMWYHEHIGGSRCPVVDTWWQTETGQILIAPLPAVTPMKPGSATRPFPGIAAEIVNERGEKVIGAGGGYLVLTRPWPGMLRTIYGDPERYVRQYWGRWGDSVYVTGDGARRDKDGYFWLLGRVDDVLNVAGHRVGTMEVESALVDHPSVAEAAVVGKPHEIKGQAIAAFVTVKDGVKPTPELANELKQHVAKMIGAIARPDEILFAADLPKTRSGKIMRRLLRDIAEGKALGDTTTLSDPAAVARLKVSYDEESGAMKTVQSRNAIRTGELCRAYQDRTGRSYPRHHMFIGLRARAASLSWSQEGFEMGNAESSEAGRLLDVSRGDRHAGNAGIRPGRRRSGGFRRHLRHVRRMVCALARGLRRSRPDGHPPRGLHRVPDQRRGPAVRPHLGRRDPVAADPAGTSASGSVHHARTGSQRADIESDRRADAGRHRLFGGRRLRAQRSHDLD